MLAGFESMFLCEHWKWVRAIRRYAQSDSSNYKYNMPHHLMWHVNLDFGVVSHLKAKCHLELTCAKTQDSLTIIVYSPSINCVGPGPTSSPGSYSLWAGPVSIAVLHFLLVLTHMQPGPPILSLISSVDVCNSNDDFFSSFWCGFTVTECVLGLALFLMSELRPQLTSNFK